MAIPLTEAATFDPQVIVPQDGIDDESASSLVPAFQSLTDRTRALKFVLDLLTAGGTASITGDLTLSTPTSTRKVTINDLIIDSHANNGTVIVNGVGGLVVPSGGIICGHDLQVSGAAIIGGAGNTSILASDYVQVPGRLMTRKAITRGGTLGGTYSYSTTLTDHVYSTNNTITAGTAWQISNYPSGADNNVIRFVNNDSTAVTIKDPTGAGINTIIRTHGQVYAVTYGYDEGAWQVIDFTVYP